MNHVLGHLSRSACWLLAIGVLFSSAPAGAQNDPDIRGLVPYMMLVIDTSGSMERLPACSCTTPSCEECLPDCSLPNVAGVPPKDGLGHERKKNRWAVVLEALTGSFTNFQCEQLARTVTNGMDYDVGYYLPYFQPWDCSSQLPGTPCAYNHTHSLLVQADNGIIDTYSNRMRFGLMTFDGFDTYVGAAPLVPAATFQADLSDGVQGLWSYGGGHTFHYPNCTEDYMIDTGVRSAVAQQGTLVSLNSCIGPGAPGTANCPSWCTTCPADQSSISTDIQKALLKTRPYGGTPIAASLDDLYDHLKNDLTDQFGSCRHRFAMLMTDGYPDDDYRSFGCDCANETPVDCGTDADLARMHCPYPTAEETARNLVHGRPNTSDKAMIEQLFVVGLAIDDANVFTRLDAIAKAGCTAVGGCDDDKDGKTALFANDLSKLVQNLDAVMSKAAGEPISRSVPAFASGIQASTRRSQYQINTGFQVGTGPGEPWTGIIERRVFSCASDGSLDEEAITDAPENRFDRVLNDRTTSRVIKTVVPPTPSNPDAYLFRGAGAPCGTACSTSLLSDVATPTVLAVPDVAKRNEVLEWMDGTTGPRKNKRLGDIYHSSPVIVGPPQFDTSDDAFNLFRQLPRVAQRPLTMFIGSNDGMLHAFSVEDYPQHTGTASFNAYAAGEEMWAFVPPLLLNDIKDNLTRHLYTMDGTPTVKNVYFRRTKGDDATGQEYHTVLITGMREGGNAYIALDVTNPTDPIFLWQFTDVDTTVTPARNVMGKTFGQAAVAQATFLDAGGNSKNGAIAILPGGVGLLGESGLPGDCTNHVTNPQMPDGSSGRFKSYAPQTTDPNKEIDHRSDVRCWQDVGRALYFVDVETGQLIKKIHKDANGRPVFPSPLVSTPAIFGSDIGSRASRAFITDADGVIWRIDLRADDQANNIVYPNDKSASHTEGWSVKPFHDIFWGMTPTDGEVSYEAPMLSVDDQGNVIVIVGTGDNNNFVKPTVKNRVVSLTERPSPPDINKPTEYKASINWEKRWKSSGDSTGLVASELVTGTMGLFNGQLFFGTFIAVTGSDACDLGKGRVHAVDYIKSDLTDVNPSVAGAYTYGPLKIASSTLAADTTGTTVINVAAADAVDNFMIMGLGITQRQTCSVVDEVSFDVFSERLPGVSNLETPAIYLVAQASGAQKGALNKRAGSVLGSVELKLNKTNTTSRVTSWATSVD